MGLTPSYDTLGVQEKHQKNILDTKVKTPYVNWTTHTHTHPCFGCMIIFYQPASLCEYKTIFWGWCHQTQSFATYFCSKKRFLPATLSHNLFHNFSFSPAILQTVPQNNQLPTMPVVERLKIHIFYLLSVETVKQGYIYMLDIYNYMYQIWIKHLLYLKNVNIVCCPCPVSGFRSCRLIGILLWGAYSSLVDYVPSFLASLHLLICWVGHLILNHIHSVNPKIEKNSVNIVFFGGSPQKQNNWSQIRRSDT